jgi:hypothetical protein
MLLIEKYDDINHQNEEKKECSLAPCEHCVGLQSSLIQGVCADPLLQ